jgi:hypothetical protein
MDDCLTRIPEYEVESADRPAGVSHLTRCVLAGQPYDPARALPDDRFETGADDGSGRDGTDRAAGEGDRQQEVRTDG